VKHCNVLTGKNVLLPLQHSAQALFTLIIVSSRHFCHCLIAEHLHTSFPKCKAEYQHHFVEVGYIGYIVDVFQDYVNLLEFLVSDVSVFSHCLVGSSQEQQESHSFVFG